MDTRVSGDISVDVMIKNFDCKHTGFLSKEGKGMLFWGKPILKYFIISKGGKEGCVWNLNCYDTIIARKQEWSISMREVESILEYNKGIVGIRIIFSDHKTSELILKCDTAKNREIWLKELKQAHKESQPFSADSAYGSGGSVPSSNWKESERESTKESNVSDYSYVIAAQTNGHGTGNCEQSWRNEDFPKTLYVNGKDDALRRLAAKSPNEKSQNRDKVKVGNNKGYKRSAKDEDTTATEECDRNSDITFVKESLSSSVQETKSGNRRSETMATTLHSKHKINSTKTNIQAQSDRLTSPSSSDFYECFELAQDENTVPKLIDGNTDLENTMTDSYSSAFRDVAGCSDSFVSIGKSKLDSDSQVLGASKGDKKSNHAMIQELTKSFQGSKHLENKVPLRKHTSLPQHQKYPPNPLFNFGKKDRVPPSAVQSIKDEGAESSNVFSSKHNETITAVLHTDSGEVNSRQVSTSHSQQTKSEVTTETENTPQNLEPGSSMEGGNNAYENITFFKNKEKNKVFVNKKETKRGSNSSTNSTSSSGSSTDSVTYESPDEGAHYENMIFVREEEYFCEREEDVKRNLQDKPPGTFLICNSGSEQKLWFVTDNGRRFFKIHRHGEKLSLFKYPKPENIFLSLNQLLMFYHLNDLPSNSYELKLERAYKSAKKM